MGLHGLLQGYIYVLLFFSLKYEQRQQRQIYSANSYRYYHIS
jgi:hypothetical protein